MELLFLTTVLPNPAGGGGEVVSHQVIDALRAGDHRVRVFGFLRPGDRPPDHPEDLSAGTRPIESEGAMRHTARWMTDALLTNRPFSVAKYRSRHTRERLEAVLAAHPPRALIVDHAQGEAHLLGLGRVPGPVIYLAHNVEREVYRGLARASSPAGRVVHAREALLIGRSEAGLADHAAQVWTLTGDDARLLTQRAPRANVRTLALPSSLAPPTGSPRPQPNTVAMLGTWTWRPNMIGLDWLATAVLPHLPSPTRVYVAGRGGEHLAGHHPCLRILGRVPDAAAFLSEAAVIAVPARAGAGVQVKTLDAIATGRPVVATSLATRGLGALPANVSVHDDPESFAAALATLAAAAPPIDPDALAWSAARRCRFTTDLATWIGELGQDPAR